MGPRAALPAWIFTDAGSPGEVAPGYSAGCFSSSSAWRMISGIWLSVKAMVMGIVPHTLNAHPEIGREAAPHDLVEDGQEEEKQAPAPVSLRQPFGQSS